MATYYVGPGGNDGNSGLTWALRKLTINGAEDVPVVANDTVYVAPGTYREQLTCDVSGNAGNPITYIGDVSGENTDGIGGIVRITGSDNDTTTARTYCITGVSKNYRTFRGFRLDTTSSHGIYENNGSNWIIEDCNFIACGLDSIRFNDAGCTDCIIRRCVFQPGFANGKHIYFVDNVVLDDSGNLVENCLFSGGGFYGVISDRVGGITVRNCTFLGRSAVGIRVQQALTVGQTVDVNNCIFTGISTALQATVAGEIVEDYNSFYVNSTDRNNVNVGGNSNAYPALLLTPILHSGASQVSGFKFPWWFGELSEWSQIAAITGSNEPTEDLLGIVRPTTAAKNSWGSVQFHDAERETTTTRASSAASLTFHDAGVMQIWVPVANVATTFSVYCYREANYAGTNPRMVIKQPGQADDTTTDAAAASQWNLLTTTLTPAADPPYVIVELQSLNTAAAGNYDSFFDDLKVT
jgi:hypothetical protein